MAHISKFKAVEVVGLLEHNGRTGATRPHIHSNQDIDVTRTKENYELCVGEGTAYERFKQRMQQVHCMKRDDVTVLDSLIVTLPKDVKLEDTRRFFEGVYKFACNDYGEKNIINATVHMDENTPHIHIGFIPVIEGTRRNGEPVEKVRHSSLITKYYLDTLHQRLSESLKKELGYEVQILNGATENGSKTVAQLKADTLTKQADELQQQVDTLQEQALAYEIPTGKKKLLESKEDFASRTRVKQKEIALEQKEQELSERLSNFEEEVQREAKNWVVKEAKVKIGEAQKQARQAQQEAIRVKQQAQQQLQQMQRQIVKLEQDNQKLKNEKMILADYIEQENYDWTGRIECAEDLVPRAFPEQNQIAKNRDDYDLER